MEQSVLHDYGEIKEELADWFMSLAETPAASEVPNGVGDDAQTAKKLLLGLREQILANLFKVVVVGEYSSGKSSLLNVLLRQLQHDGRKTDGVLPTAIIPTTAVITTLVYDKAQNIEITLDDDTKHKIDANQLNGFLAAPALRHKRFPWPSNADKNERMAERIRQVRIGCVSPLLKEGVALIDTPGIGSINKNHARITKEFTAEADAALFLVSVDPPMGEREMTFLQHIKSITDRCLFIQTKRDLGERTEHGELVWQRREREHRRRIEEVLNRSDYPFYSVSAYQAAKGLRRNDPKEFSDSGFEALERELELFLVAKRGVPRIKEWLKRGRDILTQISRFLNGRQEHLQGKLKNISILVAQDKDYEEWQSIKTAVMKDLDDNRSKANTAISDAKASFKAEVMREAQRELAIPSANQLATSTDTRLKIERTIVATVQYHAGDLLTPVLQHYIGKSQAPLSEALGSGKIPKVFQQFCNVDFDWKVSTIGVDFNDLVETRSYTRETRRGGIGFVDFFLGPIKTEVVEQKFDKERAGLMVDKTIDETYRAIKSELDSTLKKVYDAVDAEMTRIVTEAKNAANQQRRIHQQDNIKCQKQLIENQIQLEAHEKLTKRLIEIELSVPSLISLDSRELEEVSPR